MTVRRNEALIVAMSTHIAETRHTITRVAQQLRERARVLADEHGLYGSAAELRRLADELDGPEVQL